MYAFIRAMQGAGWQFSYHHSKFISTRGDLRHLSLNRRRGIVEVWADSIFINSGTYETIARVFIPGWVSEPPIDGKYMELFL